MSEGEAVAHDPLSSRSDPKTYWSRTNSAEQSPGVLTPLGWSVWGPACESAVRQTLVATGAAPRSLLIPPSREEDRAYSVFYGRTALNANFLMTMGDGIPGTSGEAVAEDLLNFVPSDVVSTPNRRRYPMVAVRMPVTFVQVARKAARYQRDTETWYHAEIARIPFLDADAARRALLAAGERLRQALTVQSIAIMCGYQPVFEQLERITSTVPMDTSGLLSGYGSHAESALVRDLWECSRERLGLDELVGRHGYHGPEEGALHATVWREDPSPLDRIVKTYRELPDDADPARAERRLARERVELERRLVASLPVWRRAAARTVLALAHVYLPLRGVGKVSFVQAIDVARAAARRLGACLCRQGVLAESEDVFFLTIDELTGRLPGDVHTVVSRRRRRRDYYTSVDLADHWQGEPEPLTVAETAVEPGVTRSLTGTGASPGVVEGTVRVITDPSVVEVEAGEILVAHTTDPSWASVMFLSSALVVDIGGINSHAAVVAREIGIPCVMGTRNGTQVLRDGERYRVDGKAGTVVALES